MNEMNNFDKVFDVLDEILKFIDTDSSLLKEFDKNDHTIALSLNYVFEVANVTKKFELSKLTNPSEYIYSRRIIMSNIFRTLVTDIHKKFNHYIVKNFIELSSDEKFEEYDVETFGPAFPNTITCFSRTHQQPYYIDIFDISSYIFNYISRINIYDIAYTSSLQYYHDLTSGIYYASRIRSINFDQIFKLYISILDIFGVMATFIYTTTMFPNIDINLPQKNLIDTKINDDQKNSNGIILY